MDHPTYIPFGRCNELSFRIDLRTLLPVSWQMIQLLNITISHHRITVYHKYQSKEIVQ